MAPSLLAYPNKCRDYWVSLLVFYAVFFFLKPPSRNDSDGVLLFVLKEGKTTTCVYVRLPGGGVVVPQT